MLWNDLLLPVEFYPEIAYLIFDVQWLDGIRLQRIGGWSQQETLPSLILENLQHAGIFCVNDHACWLKSMQQSR